MDSLQCPLAFRNSEHPMGLQRLMEIEEHVAANSPDCPHPPLKDLVFDDNSINGSTPLLLACHFNELDSVKRIVESWGVNVNQAAAYYFRPRFRPRFRPYTDPPKVADIDKATPLFVAAYMGHLDIVRYLVVKAGADVSAKTVSRVAEYDGLSPLYGAVWEKLGLCTEYREERSAIVRLLLESGADPSVDTIRPSDGNPLWLTPCLYGGYDVITALVKHGMSVNQCGPYKDGVSLLNHCIKEKSLALVEFLVDRGADLHTQDTLGFKPIIRAAFYRKWDVVDFLLERSEISRIDKIEALELAGAVILCNRNLHSLFSKGLDFWRRSINLRLKDTDGCGPITKDLPEKPGRIVEWTTQAQFEHIIQHRSEQEIQAFLIQLRILSAKSWVAVYSNYRYYLKDQLRELYRYDMSRVEVLNMLWSMLETIHTFDYREKGLWRMTLDVVGCLLQTLRRIIRFDPPLLNEDIIKRSLTLILATDRNNPEDLEFKAGLVTAEYAQRDRYRLLYSCKVGLFDLIHLLVELPHLMDEDIMESLKEIVQPESNQGRYPYWGEWLLHLACGHRYLYNINTQHLVATVSLILRLGVDPNGDDHEGNGPLHLMAIASKKSNIDPSIQESVARLLLNFGVHLDRVNGKGKTAADVWMTTVGRKRCWDQPDITPNKTDLPSWLRPDDPVPKLQCECAKMIRAHGVPYKHLLPPSLHRFVSWH